MTVNCFGIPKEYAGFAIHQGPDDRFYASISAKTWDDLRERIDFEFTLPATPRPPQQGASSMSASEWIKWYGGECPVHPARRVDVIYLSNARQTVRAGAVSWRHKRRLSDIDYYRLSEQAA